VLSNKAARYVPLACWAAAILVLVIIPAKILSEGYLPGDDALRHAAKVVSGKPWSEILVMRGDFVLDAHPGWHAILGMIYHALNCNTETLVVVAVFGLMLLVSAAVLPWLRRPEAWLAALFVVVLTSQLFIRRLSLGRPFLFTMAVFLSLLVIWSRASVKPRLWEIATTIGMIAASAWIHGTFYQLILPAAALVLAGRRPQAVSFGLCWGAGSLLGAALTGHPIGFLAQSVRWLMGVFGTHAFGRELVTEFAPSDGDLLVVLAVVGMVLWRSRSPGWRARELVEPVFMMALIGWVLGLANGRFWLDWGLPATLLWLALEFQKQFELHVARASFERVAITSGLALALYLTTTADQGSRWTRNLSRQYLSADDPQLAGWLPGKGGILYSADMDVFYETFFKNPTAPWRYILGFEPALMPPEDLEVMHRVLWNGGDVRAYEPWVKKMTAEDRLVIRTSWLKNPGPPAIGELGWALAARNLWIGRPLTQAKAPATPNPLP
jgi:hypothetical protein